MDEITIWVEINDRSYDFQVDAEEWSRMTSFEKDEVLSECEMEARDDHCAMRTLVTVTDPDGNELEI